MSFFWWSIVRIWNILFQSNKSFVRNVILTKCVGRIVFKIENFCSVAQSVVSKLSNYVNISLFAECLKKFPNKTRLMLYSNGFWNPTKMHWSVMLRCYDEVLFDTLAEKKFEKRSIKSRKYILSRPKFIQRTIKILLDWILQKCTDRCCWGVMMRCYLTL